MAKDMQKNTPAAAEKSDAKAAAGAKKNVKGTGAKAAAGAKETGKKGGGKKIILLSVVSVALFAAIVFSAFMLMDRRAKAAEAAEGGETPAKPEKYTVDFLPGELKAVQDNEEKTGEVYFEITVNNARELTAAEKAEFGLAEESRRLAAVEMDVRLTDPSRSWGLYHRRIADAKGNWLDELRTVSDESLLDMGLSDKETVIVALLDEEAAEGESLSLSVYTDSWNRKKKADGLCEEIPVEPPPPPDTTPPPRNVDTEFGNWTGKTYTSAELGVSLTLPEDWTPQSGATGASSESRSIEGSAVRADGAATMQMAVDKQVHDLSEEDQLRFFTDLLSRAVGDYTIGEPYHQTIAGKDYLGLDYSYAGVAYQIYFQKVGDNLVEIALRFPQEEKDQADAFLGLLKSME